MKALLILAAAIATQPLYAQSMATPKAQPLGNPSRWFGENDFPAAALIERPEGVVAFSLAVDTTGRVTGCQILLSSGVAALDHATCTVLTRNARFKPMTTKGVFRSSVRWAPQDHATGATGPLFASMKDEDDFSR